MERTKEDFIEVMKDKTDAELLTIVEKNSADYVPEALAAAKELLTERGVSYKIQQPLMFQPSCFAEQHYASKKRFGDYLIDMLIGYVLAFIGGVVVALCGVTEITDAGSYLIAFVVMFLYYFIMEATCGKTIGKMILGLKVVDRDGDQPSAGRIALSTLCRFVPFDKFSFLFGNGWGKDGSLGGNWHDQWSKTYVVNMKEVKEDNAR